jgi:hypothetical protein
MFTNKLINDSLAEAVKKVMKDEESGLRMAAHAAHKSGKKMFTFQGKTYPVKVQGEEVSFGEAIEEDKDCVTEPKAKEIAKKEVKSHETQHHGSKGDVAKHVKKMHKEETFKDRLIESAYGKKSPMIDEDDSEMTPEQKKKKEKIVLSMKDKEKEFKAKYGKNWKSVMYATATKLAMKEDFDPEDLEEDKDAERERKRKQKELLRQAERFEKTKPHGWGTLANMARGEAAKLNKEETEELDEISKKTLGSYVNKAAVDIARSGVTKGMLTHQSNKEIMSKRIEKRAKGIKMATKKLTGEETEQVDEVSKVEVDKFHKKLDTLVHSSFGKSSKEKKMKEEVEQIDEVGDTEKGRQALTKLIGARVQDPKGKHGLEGVKRALKRLGPAKRLRGEEVEELDEKNTSHTHAAHYENDKGEWVGMNLLVAKDDDDAIRQAHEKCKEGCRLSRVERHIPVKEEVELDEKAREPYAIGMAAAKKQAGITRTHDLPKSVVKKGHEIAKKVMAREAEELPFVPDEKKQKVDITDKSGAHHTAMSRVRHLAKQALEKQKKMKKEMIGKAGMTSEETDEE